MQKINLGIFSLLAMCNLAAAEGKKIIKWVDSKGVTQYGDKLPASEAGRSNTEMSTQGVVIKQNVAANQPQTLLDQQKLDQNRKDSVLLASYTHAEEIDLACERNLQLDKAAVQALEQQKILVSTKAASNAKRVKDLKARKKPLPNHLSDEINASNKELEAINQQLAQRKLNMQATRARYSEDKARFIQLKQASATQTPSP
jgi:hypothetical protein